MKAALYPDLAGKRALVTGSTSGIGLAIARALRDQGAQVAFHGRLQRDVAEAEAAQAPERCMALLADLSVEEQAQGAVAAVVERWGGLDLLVHSAGIWEDGRLEGIRAESLERMFRTNLYSAFYLAQAAARLHEGPASWLFIGSTAGQRGEPGHAPYAASKAALWGLVQSLAQELAPRIRVNLLSPGWVLTPMAAAELDPAGAARIASWIPNRRIGTVEDCAAGALFLCSELSGHLVGIDLPVSGGALLPIPAR